MENTDHSLKPGFFAKGTVLTHTDDDVLAANDDTVARKEPDRVDSVPDLAGLGTVGLDKRVNRSICEMESNRQC